MEQIVIIVHVVMALAIVGLILIQQGKGADAGASFGGGGSQTVFGASGGGNLLTRMTSISVTVFFVTSMGLAIIAKDKAQAIGDVDIDIPVVEQALVADDAIPEPEVIVEDSLESAIPE